MGNKLVKSHESVLVPDPNNVQVVFANYFASGGTINGVINFTLCTTRHTPTLDGRLEADPIVSARLRIDLDTAIALKNFLQTQIEMQKAPKEMPS